MQDDRRESPARREHLQALQRSGSLPARVDRRSICFDNLEEQSSDAIDRFFSFDPANWIIGEQMSCHITRTTPKTHQLIRDNLGLTPVYGGFIDSKGPRYCPSIEDKIERFSNKNRHQLFIEPEGKDTIEIYLNGFSTSLPEVTQLQALRKIKGLENVKMFLIFLRKVKIFEKSKSQK